MYPPLNQEPTILEGAERVRVVTTVLRPAQDLYEAWRQVDDLPRFIDDLEWVVQLDGDRSRWGVRGPGGREVSWEAQLEQDIPGRKLSWRSCPNSDIQTLGSVEFIPRADDRGTRVEVHLEYVAPWGAVGRGVAKVTGNDARTQVRRALHRFRQVMETGEVAVVRGQPVGEGRNSGPNGDKTRSTDANVRDIAQMGNQ